MDNDSTEKPKIMEEKQDLDTLMGHLGDWGKYQRFQFILHILSAVTAGIHMLSLVTVAAVPEHRCLIAGNETNSFDANFTPSANLQNLIPRAAPNSGSEWDSCHIYGDNKSLLGCSEWVYDRTYYESSRAIEWNFVCNRRWMGAVAQSVFMFGVFTGAVTLGGAADKYGRKTIFCWSALLQLVLGVVVAFMPEFYSFMVVRFFLGIFGSAGSYITGFVLTMELVGASKRTSCGIAFQAAFAGGIMLVAGWGAVIKDRQWLQIVYGLHGLMLAAHWWIMDESPRWLWAQGRIAESVRILKGALKKNNSPVVIDESLYVNVAKTQDEPKDEAGTGDLFKTPNLRAKTLNICLCWFANSIVYYGLSLSTGKMSGNPFLILFLMGLVELPSYVITINLMDRTGRRALISFYMIAGSLCCLIATQLTSGSAVATTIVMCGKFLIASSFAIVYNYSAELFPTVVRNSAMGLGSMCARLSGALTPLITLLDSFEPTLPAILFAVVALVSGFLTLFLPETLGAPMPQSIEDGEQFGVGDTCFTSCLASKKSSRSSSQTGTMEPMQVLEAK